MSAYVTERNQAGKQAAKRFNHEAIQSLIHHYFLLSDSIGSGRTPGP